MFGCRLFIDHDIRSSAVKKIAGKAIFFVFVLGSLTGIRACMQMEP